MARRDRGTNRRDDAGKPASPDALAQQAERVERLKEMIRKGEYDTQEKIDAILEGFIKDLI